MQTDHTAHHSPTDARRAPDRGFTLVEILIVVVILAILSTVTVFAIRGMKDDADSSACATDHKTLETALSTFEAQQPATATITEAQLVSAGYLRAESELYDIDATGAIVPQPGASSTCA